MNREIKILTGFCLFLMLIVLFSILFLGSTAVEKTNENKILIKENKYLKELLKKCNSDTTHKWCIRMH